MTLKVLRGIGEAVRPLLSDEELGKRDALEDAERAHSCLTTNLGMVRHDLEGTYFLAGDGDTSNIDLGEG